LNDTNRPRCHPALPVIGFRQALSNGEGVAVRLQRARKIGLRNLHVADLAGIGLRQALSNGEGVVNTCSADARCLAVSYWSRAAAPRPSCSRRQQGYASGCAIASASSGGPLHHSTIRPARLGKTEASRATCTIAPSNHLTRPLSPTNKFPGFGVQWLHGAMIKCCFRFARATPAATGIVTASTLSS